MNDALAKLAMADPRLKAMVDQAASAGATLPDDEPEEPPPANPRRSRSRPRHRRAPGRAESRGRLLGPRASRPRSCPCWRCSRSAEPSPRAAATATAIPTRAPSLRYQLGNRTPRGHARRRHARLSRRRQHHRSPLRRDTPRRHARSGPCAVRRRARLGASVRRHRRHRARHGARHGISSRARAVRGRRDARARRGDRHEPSGRRSGATGARRRAALVGGQHALVETQRRCAVGHELVVRQAHLPRAVPRRGRPRDQSLTPTSECGWRIRASRSSPSTASSPSATASRPSPHSRLRCHCASSQMRTEIVLYPQREPADSAQF